MKKGIYITLFAVLTLALIVFASPYIACYNLKKAVNNKDGNAISKYIEFPTLRENIKSKMMAEVTKKFMQSQKGKEVNPFEILGVSLVQPIVNNMVDVIVTPQLLINLFEDKKVYLSPTNVETQTSPEKNASLDVTYGYIDTAHHYCPA